MSKNWSTKYYQKSKESLLRKARERCLYLSEQKKNKN